MPLTLVGTRGRAASRNVGILSSFILSAKYGLEILTAVEDAFDHYGVVCDNEDDRGAALKPNRPQSGQHAVTLRPPPRECRQPVTEQEQNKIMRPT
jgi:hypothetical protein